MNADIDTVGMEHNPFRPGTGVAPPLLVGREDLKRRALSLLTDIAAGRCNPTALQLEGPRGCGKTVMLDWMEKEAQKKELSIIALPKQAFGSDDTLAGVLRWLRESLSRMGRVNLHLNGEVDIAGIKASAGVGDKNDSGASRSTVISELSALARQRALLIVDEAHGLPADVAGRWYDTYQLVARRHPLLLVIAGTPDLTRALGRSGSSFTERFDIWLVGRLSREESQRALTEPFADRVRFEADALSAVLDEAQDYPYFIQVWGRALWDVVAASGRAVIGRSEVALAATAATQARQALYRRRVDEIKLGGMQTAIAEMVFEIERDGGADNLSLPTAAGRIVARSGGNAVTVEERLLHTGFLWEADFGEWEYGIPSLADHVRRMAVQDTVKAVARSGVSAELEKLLEILPNPQFATETELLEDLAMNGQSERDAKAALNELQNIGLLLPVGDREGNFKVYAPLLSRRVLVEMEKMKITDGHHRATPNLHGTT